MEIAELIFFFFRFEIIGDNLESSELLPNVPKRSRLAPTEFKLLSGFVVYCIPPFAFFTEGIVAFCYDATSYLMVYPGFESIVKSRDKCIIYVR